MISAAVAAFWCGFGASAVAALPVYRLLLRFNSRQTISEFAPDTHLKKQGTPTMGGLIVLVGILAGLGWLGFQGVASFLPLVALVVGMAFIGFFDDWVVPRKWPGKRGLGWKQKLAMQVVVAAAAAMLATQEPLGAVLCALLVLFAANAYNFADGLDGLAGSIGMLIAAGLVLIPLGDGRPAAAVLGAIIPFLWLNAPPAKVFMGDVGSLPIGAVFGFLAFQALDLSVGLNPGALLAVAVLGLLLIVELVPPPLQIFWVKVFKKRLFPYTPIHHAFEKAGWPESRVVWTFALAQALCTAGAVSLAQGVSR